MCDRVNHDKHAAKFKLKDALAISFKAQVADMARLGQASESERKREVARIRN